jgi:hypothetical protein
LKYKGNEILSNYDIITYHSLEIKEEYEETKWITNDEITRIKE